MSSSYWWIVAFCWQFDFLLLLCSWLLVLHCCKHMRLSCALNHLLTYLLTYLLTNERRQAVPCTCRGDWKCTVAKHWTYGGWYIPPAWRCQQMTDSGECRRQMPRVGTIGSGQRCCPSHVHRPTPKDPNLYKVAGATRELGLFYTSFRFPVEPLWPWRQWSDDEHR